MNHESCEAASQLIDLLPIIIGGAIGIIGSVTTGALSHRWDRQRDSQKTIVERAEKLALLCYQLDEWVHELNDYYMSRSKAVPPSSPVVAIKAVGLVHFPAHEIQISDLALKCTALHRWWLDQAKRTLARDDQNFTAEESEAYGELWQAVIEARGELISKLRDSFR